MEIKRQLFWKYRKIVIKMAALALPTFFLISCGGGGSDSDPVARIAVLFDDLTALKGATATSASASVCGVEVGGNLIRGTVTAVHDGDTFTLNDNGTTRKIRLASIDAPELVQPFGVASQAALSATTMGQSVQVAYSQLDKYGRVVGAVFTESCQYVNLAQVANGMAWFYKAYQCELSALTRSQFQQAQLNAAGANLGLWAQQNPIAPWIYPTCRKAPPKCVGA